MADYFIDAWLTCLLYSGLADAISAGDFNPREVGRRVILPSSFTGSPRQMFELYQDSMSIVRKYGKPDLFITFTCNPKWEEIYSALLFNQKATDRPDLIDCKYIEIEITRIT